MPERTGEQGDRIAGQYYYDVNFTGGVISNITIGGITTWIQPREVTAAGTITQLQTDSAIMVENNASSSVSVLLLAASAITPKRSIYIKDALGHAGAHHITITPHGADTIDGAGSLVFTYNYQWCLLTPISTGWSVLG